MASEAGKAVYALRQRIKRINADRKDHGFGFLPVHKLSSRRRLMRSGMHWRTDLARRSPSEDRNTMRRTA